MSRELNALKTIAIMDHFFIAEKDEVKQSENSPHLFGIKINKTWHGIEVYHATEFDKRKDMKDFSFIGGSFLWRWL